MKHFRWGIGVMRSCGFAAVAIVLLVERDASANRRREVGVAVSEADRVRWSLGQAESEAYWRGRIADALKSADRDRLLQTLFAANQEIGSGWVSGCVYRDASPSIASTYPDLAQPIAVEVAFCELGWGGRKELFARMLRTEPHEWGPEADLGKGLKWMAPWEHVARRALVDGHVDLVPLIERGLAARKTEAWTPMVADQLEDLEAVMIPLARASAAPDAEARVRGILRKAIEWNCGETVQYCRREALIARAAYWLSRSGAQDSLDFLEWAREAEGRQEEKRRKMRFPAPGSPYFPEESLMAIEGACHYVKKSSEGGRAWEAHMSAAGPAR